MENYKWIERCSYQASNGDKFQQEFVIKVGLVYIRVYQTYNTSKWHLASPFFTKFILLKSKTADAAKHEAVCLVEQHINKLANNVKTIKEVSTLHNLEQIQNA